jgi:hypothetical protein
VGARPGVVHHHAWHRTGASVPDAIRGMDPDCGGSGDCGPDHTRRPARASP